MRKKNKLVFGVGINDYGGAVASNGRKIKSYDTWKHMMERCYSEKFQEKKPTYKGCSVSEEWKLFTNFKKWFDDNYKWDLDELGLQLSLDKDLLIDNNKNYSDKNCVFLPQKINKFISNKRSNNTSGAIGVSFHKARGKWAAHINDFYTGKIKHLGLFSDIELANQVYVKAREIEVIKARQYLLELGYDSYITNRLR